MLFYSHLQKQNKDYNLSSVNQEVVIYNTNDMQKYLSSFKKIEFIPSKVEMLKIKPENIEGTEMNCKL